MSRKLCLVSTEVGNLLVTQLAHELKNFNLYMSFANYFGVEGISDLEHYYRKRAEEEMLHHQWIMDYLTEADFKFVYPQIDHNTEIFEDYVTPFRLTVEREILTTQMLYRIYEKTQLEKDLMTKIWLYEHLVKEQIEEENTSRMALTIMEEDSDIYIKADNVCDLLKS